MIDIPLRLMRRLAGQFEPATFERGRAYAQDGRVTLVNEGWPAVARVRGTEGYVTTVSVINGTRFHDPGAILRGECSCPVANDCKHAVATALVALTRDDAERKVDAASSKHRVVGAWLSKMSLRIDGPQSQRLRRDAVVYVLSHGTTGERSLLLTVQKVSRLKRGGFGRASVISAVTDPTRGVPSWVPADDLRLISMLRATGCKDDYASSLDFSRLGAEVLSALAQTGRLFWQSATSHPLSYGEPKSGRLEWREIEGASGEYRIELDSHLTLLPASESHYVDAREWVLGPLDLGIPSVVVQELLKAPPVPEAMLATVRRSLQPLVSGEAAGALLGNLCEEGEDTLPTVRPHLLLRADPQHDCAPFVECKAEAVYGDQRFGLGLWHADLALARDMVEEGRLRRRMRTLLDGHREDYSAPPARRALAEARFVAHRVVPVLLEEGWICDFHDDFPIDPIASPSAWVEELRPRNNSHEWFSMELGVVVDGRSVPLLPILLRAICEGELRVDSEIYESESHPGMNLELPDGQMVYVSGERLLRWLRPLLELRLRGLDELGELKLPGFLAVDVASSAPGRFAGGAALEAARLRVAALLELEERAEPAGFATELRPYQRKGLAWLHFLHDAGYGGMLADDMGLGKTVQVLAFLHGLLQLEGDDALSADRPALVVAPRSVVGHWAAEAKRFAPGLEPALHMGSARARDVEALRRAPLLITSYQTMLRDVALLRKVSWSVVLFDEAQLVKNPAAKVRQAARQLEARSRFCITGTPIENHLEELWSQMDLVMPGVLGNRAMFSAVFRTPIEKHGSTESLELLRQRIRPFMLRRTKDRVELDLPKKTEIVERINLGTAQRDLYESLRLSLDADVRDALASKNLPGSSLTVLDALLKLRQVCCDPRLVKMPQAQKIKDSAKLERLMSMLEELADSGRFVLVFSQFTSMLERIGSACRAADIDYLELTGATRDRERVVDSFQAGEAPVFLISLKAGGTGLNLTRADTVIHYDPWWNPAAEDQATDRAHRIGQDKNVFVYKLITNGTLEERIIEMQSEKRALTDAALRDGGVTHLSKLDLDALYRRLV